MRLSWVCFLVVAVGCVDDSMPECALLVPGVSVSTTSMPAADTVQAEDWTELWRVGGRREGQELAVPVSAAVSSTGILAIPDFQLQEVILVGPDGTWLGPRFRKGRGPEEVTFPVAAIWSSAGMLRVFDLGAPKVIAIGPDSAVRSTNIAAAFVGPVVASGELLWAGVKPDNTVLIYPGPKRIESASGNQLESLILQLEPGAEQADTLVVRVLPAISAPRFRSLPAPAWARPVAAVGFNGRMAAGGFDESYRLLLYDSAGAATRQICGWGPPLPVTPAERGELDGEGMEALAAAIREADQPPEPAAYGRLVVGADGRVWVQRDRQSPAPGPGFLYGQPGALYDVFEWTGQQVMTVRIPRAAYLLEARGDTIWTFEIGEFDEVEVVSYQRSRG